MNSSTSSPCDTVITVVPYDKPTILPVASTVATASLLLVTVAPLLTVNCNSSPTKIVGRSSIYCKPFGSAYKGSTYGSLTVTLNTVTNPSYVTLTTCSPILSES